MKYWKAELPEAEIVIGRSKSAIFCKAEALNDAVKKSTGRVLVILDADAYMSGEHIRHCAKRILEELAHGERLWYVPYRRLYRLNQSLTDWILLSNPRNPFRPSEYLGENQIENYGNQPMYGHHYGAMCMIFPRDAYKVIGCFDERFKGWGGEDIALLKALDVMWGKHKTTKNAIYHLRHPFIGTSLQERRWDGQEQGNVNSRLATRYNYATSDPVKMRGIVQEAIDYKLSNK